MKKRILCLLLSVFLLLPWLAVPARADAAPKPTVSVRVLPGGGERIIVTLLALEEGWGPNGDCTEGDFDEDAAAERAFARYAAENGLHFWGQTWEYDVAWNYYPPEQFHVAVYYPDSGVLLVSRESVSRYAFHSDFRVTLPRLSEDAQSGIVDMAIRRDTDWMEEGWEFFLRVLLTLLVELFLALVWKYRGSEQLRCILRVNLLTQVGLNVLLWMWYWFDGPLNALLRLAIAEVVVLAVEAWLYLRRLPNRGSAWRVTGYTLTANLCSVWLGFAMLE